MRARYSSVACACVSMAREWSASSDDSWFFANASSEPDIGMIIIDRLINKINIIVNIW